MPKNFDRTGRTPDQPKPLVPPKAESRFSDIAAFVSQRTGEIDRILTVCKGIEVTGSKHPQYADACFRRAALELQQRWLEMLAQTALSEEVVNTALGEIQERLGAIDAIDSVGKYGRMIRAERQELIVVQAAFRSRIEEPVATSAPADVDTAVPASGKAVDIQVTETHSDADKKIEEVSWVVLRPDAKERTIIGNEEVPEWVLRMGAPRLAMLREILGEMGQQYREIVGQVDPASMREHPYHGFYVARLRRAIFVNDDYGQATYIVQGDRSFEALSKLSKRELRMFTDARRISYPGDPVRWREIIEHALTNDLEGERIGRDHLSLSQIHRILQESYGLHKMQDAVLVGLFDKMIELPEFAGIEYRRDTGITSRSGNAIYEYNPEFVERATDLIVVFTKPNDGWKTIGAVKNMATEELVKQGKQSVDHLTVSNMLGEYLASQEAEKSGYITRRYLGKGTPSAEDQKNNSFGLRSHFSPELVKVVVDRLVREASPIGWSTLNTIRVRLRGLKAERPDGVVKKKALELAASHSTEYQTGYYRDSGPKGKKESKGLNFFCNPALTEELIKYFSKKTV